MGIKTETPLNVLDEPLSVCSENPLTGFFRDGCCNTNDDDVSSHTICVEVSKTFLEYSRFKGNDLTTPVPEFGFPGLNDGDRWCLCAQRWLEAYNEKMAPRVHLMSTHKKSLEIVPLNLLKQFAIDLN
jgi:uncharacterized protein (DUF2237 family)|tara:strand:- start:1105 stop:1488 length:384 start_codon:yes stop_codon:yes gene_type:complete